jgi:hypothetical protein
MNAALSEINLKNKDDKLINSRQAEASGGILAALENAGVPSSLNADFGSVSLLNKVRIFLQQASEAVFCSLEYLSLTIISVPLSSCSRSPYLDWFVFTHFPKTIAWC